MKRGSATLARWSSLLSRPSRWGVRIRSAVAAGAVVFVALAVACVALMAVLDRSLVAAADDAASERTAAIATQLKQDSPAQLDGSLLSTDQRIVMVQILDSVGRVVQASSDAPAAPVLSELPAPEQFLRGLDAHTAADGDLRISATTTDRVGGRYTVVVAAGQESIESTVATVGGLLALGSPFIVAISAAMTFVLVGHSLRSVEKIRTRVAEISSADLSERVPVPPQRDEIAALAETMNEMLGRIETGHNAQRRFVGDASHELRSPLATVTAALELGRDRPEMLDRALIDDTLLPEALRMRQLVDDLLLLARVDERGLHPRIGDVDLDDIVDAEVTRKRAEVDIAVNAHLAPTRLRGDAGQLSRMARNLIDNAARYASTTVDVRVWLDRGGAHLRVCDDGPGIPLADRQRVFERFVRLHQDRGRASGGSGLGLAIVAQIVAAHQGSVEISAADGAGSGGCSVLVTLPTSGPVAGQLSPGDSR